MITNEEILKTSVDNFNSITGHRQGDYLKLPYGLYTRFTHIWEDTIQTGGHEGNAYYLGKEGYTSYSGSLDSGVKKTDIVLTSESKSGAVWFFDKGWAAAHSAVYFEIDFRVYELREGADTSGLPQIKRYEREQFLKTCDTITRINGNGQEYTLPLPEVHIPNLGERMIKQLEEATGLKFTSFWNGFKTQPQKKFQLDAILNFRKFKSEYYNNSWNENTLMLSL